MTTAQIEARPEAFPASRAVYALQAGLERLGWSILNIDINLANETARIELRAGSRLVTFDGQRGRSSITRESVEVETVTVGRRGDRCRVDRIRTRFLGRTKVPGVRFGLRVLCNYIADNAPRPALASDVRTLLCVVMDGNHHQLTAVRP